MQLLRQRREDTSGTTIALGLAPVNEVRGQRVDDAGEPMLLRAHCGKNGGDERPPSAKLLYA